MSDGLKPTSSSGQVPNTGAFVVWNLIGHPGSGKTTAANFFVEAGVAVVDADEIAAELMGEGGKAHGELLSRFGTADTMEIRKVYMEDPQAVAGFFAVLAPMILEESLDRIHTLAAAQTEREQPLAVVYSGTLPVEPQRFQGFAGFIEIEIPVELRTQRLVERDGIDPKTAEMLSGGPPPDPTAAILRLDNSGSRQELRSKVAQLVETLQHESVPSRDDDPTDSRR